LPLPILTLPEPPNPPDHQHTGLRAKPDAQILKSSCALAAFVNSPCLSQIVNKKGLPTSEICPKTTIEAIAMLTSLETTTNSFAGFRSSGVPGTFNPIRWCHLIASEPTALEKGKRRWGILLLIALFWVRLGSANAGEPAVNRTLPAFSPPHAEFDIPETPTVRDIASVHLLPEALVPVHPTPSAAQNKEIADALRLLSKRTVRDDFSALEQFVNEYPDSPWTPSVLFNLGLGYYRTGWYSKAINAWETAWPALKPSSDLAVRAVADDAVGELALMYARVGRMRELAQLLDPIKDRPLLGPGRGKVAGARQGLWTMQHEPEISFRCGPLALDRIIAFQNPGKGGQLLIQNSHSTTNGFSLNQVAALSRKAGLNYQMAFRSAGASVLLPAVVNWKVGHYAALVKEKDGFYLLQDPTFRNDVWVSPRALENEASGYFLVPPGDLPRGWRSVSEAEGSTVWGKGTTGSSDPNNNTPNDQKSCGGVGSGMAVSSVYLLDVSLNIRDKPVGYDPPVGPPVRLEVNYNQLESDQPAVFSYANLGAQWTFNFLAYITDDPQVPDADVSYFTVGGGTLPFTDFDDTSQSFASQIKSQAVLTRTSANSYQMLFADGSSYIFSLPDSTNTVSRRVFLTRMVDPQGNSVQISFDSSFRVVAVTDAIGQVTTFSYQDPGDRLKITKVTDPFGRFATFQYDSNNRLSEITDCIGLTSQFAYDSGDNILTMTTPYGTTSYAFGQEGRDTWLETTYPDGEKDRAEYSESTSVGTDSQDPASTLPQGIWTRDWVMYARNTYFWDRNAYWAYAANTNDYTKAHIFHWLHDASLSTAMGVLESEKAPLENRVWYNYAGQPAGDYYATIIGTSAQPIVVARVLDDGSTQLRQYAYNALGHLINSIDPLGRGMTCVYSTNLIDLLEVRQTTGTNNDLLLKVQYNSQHRPIAIYDASGELTTNTYNSRGQLLTATDPKGETTSFTYDTNGYLLTITGPLQTAGDQTNFTYDSFGRVRTMTNTEGYTLTYSYDNLDRITNVTHPDGTFEAFSYNKLDRVMAQDRLGHQTIYSYDSLRRMVSMQDPLHRVTCFQYCGCGSLSALIDPNGQQTSWVHDVQGRLTGKVYADGSRATYNYENTTSRLQSVVDEEGQYKVFSYYQDDALESISYPAATVPTASVTYAYDSNYGRVVSMKDGMGTTTYTYNPVTSSPTLGASRLASASGPLPNSLVTYQYDPLGRVIGRAINGVAESVSFDALGRPTNIANALGAFVYSYVNATTRLASEVYPNGQSNSYTYYNNIGDQRLQQIQHFKPGGALLSAFGYSYNAVGLITSWTNQWDTISTGILLPTYDAAYQLTNVVIAGGPFAVSNYTYGYDAAGNRLLVATNGMQNVHSCNSLNQLVSTGPGPTNTSFQWDGENRLTAINAGLNDSTFSYDGLGRRSEIVEKTNSVVVTNNYYLWCDNEICEVRDPTGTTVVKRLFPQGEVTLGATGSTNYFYTRDHLGSVREALDSSGTLVTRYTYDPYGQKSVVEEGYATAFGFGGDFVHQRSSLNLTRFRPYDSAKGRWLSRDPISAPTLILLNYSGGFGLTSYVPPQSLRGQPLQVMPNTSGINLYEFALNNPVNFTDPLGLSTFTVGLSVSGQLGPINLNYSAGIAIDGHGNIGTFGVPGGGVGVGAGVSGGVSFTGSNAETICDLGGWFDNFSVGAGAGVDASIEGFTGPSDHGPVVGGGFTLGAGLGAGGSVGASYTVVNPIGRLW